MITRRMNLRSGRCPEHKERVGLEESNFTQEGTPHYSPAAAGYGELNHSRLMPAVAVAGTARYYSVRAHQSGRL